MRLFYLSAFCLLVLLSAGISFTVYAAADGCGTGNHNYQIVTHDATENEDGEIIYTCLICGYEYIEVLEATGHDWGEWVTKKEASCTQEGLQVRTCSRNKKNKHTEEKTIPALDHDYEESLTPASCGKDGIKVYKCRRCGNTYEETFEKALKHEYVEKIVKQPGCETNGFRQYICTRCQDTYEEAIPATGHAFGEWIIDREPTENECGHRYRVCGNDSRHILEEELETLTGTEENTPEINAFDIVFATAGVSGASVFGVFIYWDYRIILWDARKRKLRLMAKKEKESKND